MTLLAILLAVLSSFLLGGWWYSPSLFLHAWVAENAKGHTVFPKEGAMKGHGVWPFVFSSMGSAFSCWVFNAYLQHSHITDPQTAAWQGFLIGAAFVTPSFATNYAFGGKTGRLLFIDGAYHTLTFVLFGAILAGLRDY